MAGVKVRSVPDLSWLRPEQAAAVAWMAEREAQIPAGGILADDVGMGKTYTIAGLVLAHPLHPTLVVCPKSCLWHWAGVLSQHSGTFPVVVHKPSRAALAIGADLVVASYSCLQASPRRDSVAYRELIEAVHDREWGRIVLDEAHELRNPKTRSHRAVLSMKAHARWAVTATPMQNHGGDLAALARLIGAPADDLAAVRSEYVLRRRHALPAGLTVRDVMLDLRAGEERELYARVREEASRRGRSGRGVAWEMLLRCRQACTHPALYHRSMAGKSGISH